MSTESLTTNTIEAFIASEASDEINYNALSFLEHLSTIDIPIKNVFEDYLTDIEDLYVTIDLTEPDLYYRYRFRPKLLCYDVYGNPELYFIIMRINGVYNMKDFDRRSIKMLKPADMADLLQSIYSAEKGKIDEYNYK